MQIQSNLASTIAMAFDECPPSKADRQYVENLWSAQPDGSSGANIKWTS